MKTARRLVRGFGWNTTSGRVFLLTAIYLGTAAAFSVLYFAIWIRNPDAFITQSHFNDPLWKRFDELTSKPLDIAPPPTVQENQELLTKTLLYGPPKPGPLPAQPAVNTVDIEKLIEQIDQSRKDYERQWATAWQERETMQYRLSIAERLGAKDEQVTDARRQMLGATSSLAKLQMERRFPWMDHTGRRTYERCYAEWRKGVRWVDMLYFSLGVSLTATFGDITPNSRIVRVLISIQLLIAVFLAALTGAVVFSSKAASEHANVRGLGGKLSLSERSLLAHCPIRAAWKPNARGPQRFNS